MTFGFPNKTRWIIGVFALTAITATCCGNASSAPSVAGSGSAKVDALLAKMSLQEKIALIRGVNEDASTYRGQAGYLPGVPRLGIPPLRLADGPPGLLTREPSPAMTATMGLAATFSKDDARDNGQIIAQEARRLGIDVVLQPFINIDRDISFRRGFNTFGEDPVLTGEMGAAQITGIQERGVMAQAKHFVGFDTNAHDVNVDSQALHEIYLAPFADAIAANVSSIMCSYNKINGEFACGNNTLLNTILKQEMGFKGFVTSDWGAVHSNSYLSNGLDMEMPGVLPAWSPFAGMMNSYFDISSEPKKPMDPHFDVLAAVFEGGIPEEPKHPPVNWAKEFPADPDPKNLWAALKEGKTDEATITRAAARVLNQMDRFGYLSKGKGKGTGASQASGATDLDIEDVIQKTSEDSAVLLRNENNALPLTRDDLKSLVLIGPGAGQVVAIGRAAERSVGIPARQTGPFDAIRKLASDVPDASITYVVDNDMTGTTVPASMLSHAGKVGLVRTGTSGETVDVTIDFTKSRGNALPADGNVTWTGTLNVPSAGNYYLYLQTLGARGNISVDGKRLGGSASLTGALHGDTVQANLDNVLPTTDGLDNVRTSADLSAGPHDISITITGDTSKDLQQVRLNWVTPEVRQVNHEAAIAAAKKARTAVVFLWTRGSPTFGLPGDQDKLVEEVAAVNPNTIVVLNTSQPIAMPWLAKTRAVVQMWWSGDRGGVATADVLLGKHNPAGRLPFTWAQRLEDYPATSPSHPERSANGVDGKTYFSEGVDVGYRWFDKERIEPLYPFGYGLSYSKFDYSAPRVTKTPDGGLDVAFTVRNAGLVAGDEVPQIYLGAPKVVKSGVQFPERALAAFDRVLLKPGESRQVVLHVPLRRLQYWSTANGAWVTVTKDRTVFIGASSRDLRLSEAVPTR
ncbi:glycoside hydrolase family 3 C-terminal domain-containing protein [Caballeronia mineralivorans]|jgi:beta-glucosidase|uniref:beta-glucosidase n=1 Tax=Caballeronia mineralivorans TaxID=2010198 RepID=UPI003211CCAC|nr:Beta-glucosidase [Caballeronia mineralivorans]